MDDLQNRVRRARAEAASWVTRLHGPNRSPELEAGLRAWLALDVSHRDAFELATEVWQKTADLPGKLPARDWEFRSSRRQRRTVIRKWAIAAAAIAAIAIAARFYLDQARVMKTGVGEQRVMTLPDGSRVELNTGSRMVLAYSEDVRKVLLESGEVWFDVARDPSRPFIVVAGDRSITALGTSFIVRREESGLTVTLLAGKLAVAVDSTAKPAAQEARADTILQPGERLTLSTKAPPSVDSPELARVTAWQRGQVLFEDTPLADAIGDFNRYSTRKLICKLKRETDACARIRVGGTFHVGDVVSFARAVAASNGLGVAVSQDHVELNDGM